MDLSSNISDVRMSIPEDGRRTNVNREQNPRLCPPLLLKIIFSTAVVRVSAQICAVSQHSAVVARQSKFGGLIGISLLLSIKQSMGKVGSQMPVGIGNESGCAFWSSALR